MRKILIIAIMIITAGPLLPATQKFSLEAGAAYFNPFDSHFRELYGSGQVSPTAYASFIFFKGLYGWFSYGFINTSGEVPVLKDEIKARQDLLACGLGWENGISRKMKLDIDAGAARIGFREEGMGATYKDAKFGLAAAIGLKYFLGKKIFVKPFVSLAGATAEVSGVTKKLGGVALGARLGIAF